MGDRSARGMSIAGGLMTAAAVFQAVSLFRYLDRLPNDTLGVWLHVATILLLLIAASLFFRNSRQERRRAD